VTSDDLASYRTALRSAREAFLKTNERLQAIQEEQVSLANELVQLRRTISALSALCSEEPALDKLGITSSCEQVMEAATAIMTTKDVIDALDQLGFDLASQKNAMASVHSVLTRMAGAKKIEKTTLGSQTAWKGPNFDPDSDIPF